MRLMVLVAALTAFAGPALAGDWRVVGDADDYLFGIDVSQIRRSGDLATVWAIQSSLTGYRVSRIEIDCRNETLATLTMTEFDNAGRTVMSDHRRETARSVYPDSTGASLMKAGCDRDFSTRPGFASPSQFHRSAMEVLMAG